MADHRVDAETAGQGLRRRDVLKLAGCGLAAAATAGSGVAIGADRTLTIGNIGWDEDVALAYLSKVLLEQELGYRRVIINKRGVEALFRGVANGGLDTFQDVWLPDTHRQYWQQYGQHMERLDSWYLGTASLGLTVPDYVSAHSIDDLNKYPDRFRRRIVGIEPGAGEMRIVSNRVMPGYQLNAYRLVASSTPHMLAELESALHHKAPIVVTLYKPHWAFTVYRIRYLDDPKGLISRSKEQLYTVVRRGLQQDRPDAYAFLNAMRLSPDQLGRLELAINLAGDPEEGVKNWLNADRPFGARRGLNRDAVQPWIDAALRARANAQ